MEMLRLTSAPSLARYLATFVMTALATAVTIGLDREVTIPNLSLIYVLPVVTAAVVFGLGPSLFSAVLGALAYNYFLTEPRYTLIVNDPANIWAIGLLFVVGCIASAVASMARRTADDATFLKRQMRILQTLSHDIPAAEDTKAIASVAADALAALFGAPVIIMLMADAAVEFVDRSGAIQPTEIEMEAARSSLATGKLVAAGVYPFDASRFDFWPVTGPGTQHVVIGLAFEPEDRPPNPGNLVEIVAGLLWLALGRQQVRAQSQTKG
ncbi:DUF4118 domain-containing protein (plasmid) [Rhizobium jaguaris]|uniref:DUF4118 domain-containing protein n=2 Tax=Rhizobium jaguaris TaxID=1312183 RepID=A0A387FR24_9HYPH|nr:DUF4118 domain-containing protein [Rhizobium jaguaris]